MSSFTQKIKSINVSNNSKIQFTILIFHTSLFLTLLVLALFIFKSDLNSLWSAGIDCRHCNDSWKFIENTLNPTNPPTPYHPIATSLHYLVFYILFSAIFPSFSAIVLSVFLVQFVASLITLYLLYNFFLEICHLDSQPSLVLIFVYDLIIISPYLLLATSEILFLFYQMLAWACLVRRQYFFAAITSTMTFALRFNGAFFVIGMFLILFLKWWKTKEISLRLVISIVFSGILMFIVGFSSFILSWLFRGDFWQPLTSQNMKYQTMHEYATDGALSLPFLWWPRYIQYVLQSNSTFELLSLILALISLGLGFFSLYKLYMWLKDENTEYPYSLSLIFLCGFLGLNFIVSGRDFSRFLSYTFPIYPVVPLTFRDHDFSSLILLIVVIGAAIWGLFFNIVWWMTYPI